MSEQTNPEQSGSYAAPLTSARAVRGAFIGLTHALPPDSPKAVLRLWGEADTALLAFIRELESRS